MKNISIRLLDKLFIANIYISLLFEQQFFSKFLFTLSFFVFLLLKIQKNSIIFNLDIVSYLSRVYYLLFILLIIGIYKDNSINNAIIFIFPFLSLISLIFLFELNAHYGLNRYLKHYLYTSILIAFKLYLIIILFNNNMLYEHLPFLNPEISQSTWIDNSSGLLRVYSGQIILLPFAILLSYVFQKKYVLILSILFIVPVYQSQTISFYFAYFIVIIFLSCKDKKIRKYFLYYLLFILLIIYLNIDNLLIVVSDKLLSSIPVKIEQYYITFENLTENPFFGKGLGYIFPNGSIKIESVPLNILYSTGFLGFLIYTYILLYWFIKGFFFIYTDSVFQILTLYFFIVLICSFSNPYVTGANSGLYIISFACIRFIGLKNRKYLNG